MFPVFCPNWLSFGILAVVAYKWACACSCLVLFCNPIILYGFMWFGAGVWLHLFLY